MIHAILFVVTPPTEKAKWDLFIANASPKLATDKHVKRLSENVWLLEPQKSMTTLGHLIALADNQRFAIGILPLEHELQWLPADFDPTSSQGHSAGS